MQSLKDKLLKAGLVSEEQAKKAEEDKAKAAAPRAAPSKPEPAGHGRPPPRDRPPQRDRPSHDRPPSHERPLSRPRPPSREHAAELRVPKLPPLPGSKEAQRNEAKKQVQLDRFLREKVLAAQVGIEPGATTFYFVTRKGKLRRLDLSETQAKLLEEGKLAVVERPDPDKIEHALVPPEAAGELFAQSEKTVRFWNKDGKQAVGFLTEEEIANRQSELTEPDATQAAAAAPAEPASSEPQAETWITIKRSSQ